MTSLKALEKLSCEELLNKTHAVIASMAQRNSLEIGTSLSEYILELTAP
jgi:hypothetical protein